jgi:hypothetical protein
VRRKISPAYVSIRQHTSAYVSIRQHTSAYVSMHTSANAAYVSVCCIRQHTYLISSLTSVRRKANISSAFVSICQHLSAFVSICQHLSAFVSICQHLSAFVSIRQHTSARSTPAERQHLVVPFHAMDLLADCRQHTPAYVSIRQHTSALSFHAMDLLADWRLLRCQYLYFCTSTASKVSNLTSAPPQVSVFVLLY